MIEAVPKTNYDYFKQQWHLAAPAQRRRRLFWLVLLGSLWLAGAIAAYLSVSGIMRLGTAGRLLTSLLMGPMGLLWSLLKLMGVIAETTAQPNLLWLILAGLSGGFLWLSGNILGAEPNQETLQKRRQVHHARAQGQIDETEAAEKLAIESGVPLAEAPVKRKQTVTVGMDYETGEGHALVVGPTRSGKGLHLTETLLRWPGAAIIVDPKGEQHARTAGYRRQVFGSPIFCLPGHQVHLSYYFDRLLDEDSVIELHNHLLRPGDSRERIFADKCLSLFSAVGHYAQAHTLNAIRVLMDAGVWDPTKVLAGLETVAAARQYARVFTDGKPPSDYHDNRFATSAYGTFTTRLAGYQKHVDTIAPLGRSERVIPANWAAQGATIYITYSLADLEGVGGVVAAVMAGLLRYQVRNNRRDPILAAVDELPTVGLYNVANYLSTVGSYRITMLLYAQAISQLQELYGDRGTQSILANTVHQVWYPPADVRTAREISNLYGTAYKPMPNSSTSRRQSRQAEQGTRVTTDYNQGQGWQIRPALEPGEVMGLPREHVAVLTQRDRQYRFLAGRLNPLPRLDVLPAPPSLPRPASSPRPMTDWGAPVPNSEEDEPPTDGERDSDGVNNGESDVTADLL